MKLSPLILALLALALPALAQQSGNMKEELKKLRTLPFKEETLVNISVPGLKVEGFVSGSTLVIDEAFATKHENKPPAVPFRLILPKGKDILITPGGKETGIPELVKLMTGTADKRAIEILRFVTMTVPLQEDPADRLKLCAYLLRTQIDGLSRGYEKVGFLEEYATKIGGNDAAVVHIHMTKVDSGEHYAVKLAGILHPSKPGGVMGFLMANTELSEIKNPADLASKGVGLTIIHSLSFVDPAKK